MSTVTDESVIALTNAINALNDTIINTFAFNLETFGYINGMAFVIFVTGFSIGHVIKTLRKV